MTRTALIAGRGALPAAVVAAMGVRPLICALDGFAPDGVAVDQTFRIERLAIFLRWLADQDISRVVFAGAVQRPRLDPSLMDPHSAQILPPLMAAFQAGDDATLRAVVGLFEDAGLTVVGVADIAPALVPGPGILAGQTAAVDDRDAVRAVAIVRALGHVDVGQGAVVQQGLCLAVEVLAGSDAMLDAVAQLPADLRPDSTQGKGVYYKAPKPGQDLRIDLPTLGVQTVHRAAAAGLAGIAWQAGGVICLDLPEMIRTATETGLFLWARAA
jgi:UDP-2,3-diacylglucosamine hydrolase